MKKNIAYKLLAFVAAVVLTSCGKQQDPNNEVEYLPFQESKDGKWGLISNEGEVLFSEEFTNEPTYCVNGRFLVKNSDGLWEIYTAEKKPEKIGGEYLQAGLFYEDVAPVVEKGKPIQFIDKDGDVKVTLDKLNGKSVELCTNFSNGLALVKVGEFWGAVNKSGKVVVEPEYLHLVINSDGRMFGLNKRYKDVADEKKYEYTCLSKSGKEIGSLKMAKINSLRVVQTSYRTQDLFVDDGIVVSATKNDKDVEGIIGMDGEWVMKPSDKLSQFKDLRGDHMTFIGSDGYGLIGKDGDVRIRPKFFHLYFVDDKILAGQKERSGGYKLYDLEGEKISDEEYEAIYNFHKGEDYTIAMIGNADYVLLDRKGKEKKIDTDIYNIGLGSEPNFVFEGDYVDIGDIVSGLKIQKNGFIGLTLDMKAPQAIETVAKLPNIRNFINGAAKYNTYGEYLTADMEFGKGMVDIEIAKEGLIKTTRTRSGWFTSTNYEWSDQPISRYQVYISSDRTQQLKGQMKKVYTEIANEVKKQGSVTKEGKNAVVVNTGGNSYYYAFLTGERVYLCYGKFNPDSLQVSEYDNVTEEDPIVPGKIGQVLEVDSDSIAIDTISANY